MARTAKTLALALVLLAPTVGHAATINFDDGTFALPPWTSMTISGLPNGQTSSQAVADGNPGAYLSVTTLTNAETFTAHINEAFVYDPSQGAIDSLDISLDFRNTVAFGQGHGVSAVLAVQNGSIFVSSSFITGSTDFAWQNFSAEGLTAENFALVQGAGQLDFGTTGAPITFGFRTGNSGGNGINVGYDNYSLAIHTVPVPATLPLLVGALASLGWLRRSSA